MEEDIRVRTADDEREDVLSDEQVERLRGVARTRQEAFLIELLLAHGLDLLAILNLTHEDLDVKGSGERLTTEGRHGRRTVALAPEATRAYQDFVRKECEDASGFVFRSVRSGRGGLAGQRWRVGALRSLLWRMGRDSGAAVSAKVLRTTSIARRVRGGASADDLRQAFGLTPKQAAEAARRFGSPG